jgi:hypothetical protein
VSSFTAALLSLLCLALAAWFRPTSARCPGDLDLRTGIRRDGRFACWPHPVGDPEWDGTYLRPERSVQPAWVLEGRVYCTGTTRPTVVDWQTVRCR